MHRIPVILTFWPGLPQLWLYGRWSGLVTAMIFAGFLNLVLYSTYRDPELISRNWLIGCWVALGSIWILTIFQNDRLVKDFSRNNSEVDNQELDRLFVLAQSEYLRGHFDEAEKLFERIVRLAPDDLDSRIYLATLCRHQGKINQACRYLDEIESRNEQSPWLYQVEQERTLLAELESELKENSEESGEAGQTTVPALNDQNEWALEGPTTKAA